MLYLDSITPISGSCFSNSIYLAVLGLGAFVEMSFGCIYLDCHRIDLSNKEFLEQLRWRDPQIFNRSLQQLSLLIFGVLQMSFDISSQTRQISNELWYLVRPNTVASTFCLCGHPKREGFPSFDGFTKSSQDVQHVKCSTFRGRDASHRFLPGALAKGFFHSSSCDYGRDHLCSRLVSNRLPMVPFSLFPKREISWSSDFSFPSKSYLVPTQFPGGALCTVEELRQLHQNCLVLSIEAVWKAQPTTGTEGSLFERCLFKWSMDT